MKTSGKTRTFAIVALALAFAAAAWLLQRRIARAGGASTGGAAPSPAAEMITAGLGGFRGIIAEIVWFRADRLQEDGKYAELAQLSAWLTFLEPHTAEVWAYTAWNLAYNVSVMMPDAPDRWRWVEAGMRLLRDDGLRLNPDNPVLYRELAWLFLAKLGGSIDLASPYYREAWKREVEKCAASGDWSALRLDREKMDEVDAEYGRQDWTHPYASALYWAHQGLAFAKKSIDRIEVRQVIYQALMLEALADSRFAQRALAEMETAARETGNPAIKDLCDKFRSKFGL